MRGPASAPILLLSLLAALLGQGCGDASKPAAESGQHYPVSVVSVERGPVRELLETFGTVELDPERTQTLTAPRSGRVAALHAVEGQAVTKGEVLLELEPVPEDNLDAERARIDLEFARRDLERVQRMAKLKLATNQEVQAAEKQVEASRAVLGSMGLEGENRAPVPSPMEGVVAALSVGEGALVQPGQDLVQVAPEGSVAVRVGFEVEEMSRLSEGLPVLILPVFQGPEDREVEARLSRLHRVADPATQLVEGLVHVDAPPAWAVAGTRARVRVVLRSASDVVRVPRDVIVTRGDARGVFVVRQDRARFQPIETGVDGGEWVEVRSGLAEGSQVVRAGRSGLTDGTPVRRVP